MFECRPRDHDIKAVVICGEPVRLAGAEGQRAGQIIGRPGVLGQLAQSVGVGRLDVESDQRARLASDRQAQIDDAVAASDIADIDPSS